MTLVYDHRIRHSSLKLVDTEIKAVVHAQRHRLDADEFPMIRVVGLGKEFLAI